MTISYIKALFAYDTEINSQLLDTLKGLDYEQHQGYKRTRQVFNHILHARKIWITRLNGKSSADIPVWPELSWEESTEALERNDYAYDTFLSVIADEALAGEITYQNSRGTTFRQPIADILMHVLMHGAYHRGQIAADMRRLGDTPLVTDFAFYNRKPVH